MYSIGFEDVTKQWPGRPPALDHLNLSIAGGEFFSLVGPSGCGKTTALRVLAGLEQPTRGKVFLGRENITRLETRRRHFGLVTQQNQLMNHLTTAGNIGFPLEIRPRTGTERPIDRVRDEAKRFGIEHLLDKRPKNLSEGQRRMVQLARAVISSPSTLLMDEPLGFLEERTRVRVRSEILRIHHDRGVTSLMATASQHDAMVMSDRIAVMFDGVVDQIGSVVDVFERPATRRVAAFFGEPAMNIVPARMKMDGHERALDVLGRSLRIRTDELDGYANATVLVGIRPADVAIGVAQNVGIECRVAVSESVGASCNLTVVAPCGTKLRCSAPGRPPSIGMVLDVGLPIDRVHVFDASTGMAILHPRA